jgi:hypothetical protein
MESRRQNQDEIQSAPEVFRAESLDGGYSHRLRTFRSLGDFELDSLILL